MASGDPVHRWQRGVRTLQLLRHALDPLRVHGGPAVPPARPVHGACRGSRDRAHSFVHGRRLRASDGRCHRCGSISREISHYLTPLAGVLPRTRRALGDRGVAPRAVVRPGAHRGRLRRDQAMRLRTRGRSVRARELVSPALRLSNLLLHHQFRQHLLFSGHPMGLRFSKDGDRLSEGARRQPRVRHPGSAHAPRHDRVLHGQERVRACAAVARRQARPPRYARVAGILHGVRTPVLHGWTAVVDHRRGDARVSRHRRSPVRHSPAARSGRRVSRR